MNCLSRLVAGALLDRFRFNRLMPVLAALLTIILICIFFIGQTSFVGLIICNWSIYLLSFSHFSTVPAQVNGKEEDLFIFHVPF
jgi:predicted MFS family arabinose efflux permease